MQNEMSSAGIAVEVDAFLSQHGHHLMATLLRAACSTIPRRLLRSLADVLLLLIHSPKFGSAARQWLQSSFGQSPALGEASCKGSLGCTRPMLQPTH